jgi:glycosyltransferase involved in cell wall biosynthesis
MDAYPITVVIPVRNMAATLERAVRSALDAGASEVVIVNDASTDNTESIARELCHKYGVDTVLDYYSSLLVPAGVCFTRNYGIVCARNRFIVCLDADDMLTPESLTALTYAYEPGTWVYGGWRDMSEEGVHIESHPAPPPGMLNRKTLCHATFLFSKEDWRKVGGFDPDFSLGIEDWAFQCALTAAGVQPKRVDALIYNRTVGINERSKKATRYYPFLFEVLRDKYPSVFAGR